MIPDPWKEPFRNDILSDKENLIINLASSTLCLQAMLRDKLNLLPRGSDCMTLDLDHRFLCEGNYRMHVSGTLDS